MSVSPFADEYRRARAGDGAAFAALVARYQERLHAFVSRRMGAQARRRSEPDDVLQAVVLTLWERLASYPEDLEEDELRAYVLQIAKWRIADLMKRRREGGESQMPREAPARAPTDAGPVTRADERAWTREQIARLEPKYAEVLKRFHVEGESVAQIAHALGLGIDAVKQRLVRGRARLRERMGEGS